MLKPTNELRPDGARLKVAMSEKAKWKSLATASA